MNVDIEDAFLAVITDAFGGTHKINYENTQHGTGDTELNLTMFPGSSIPDDLSNTNEVTGLFQIEISTKKAIGAIQAKIVRDQIASQFPFGRMVVNNIPLDINEHFLLSPTLTPTRYKLPIRVAFTATIPR
jgi:hypothetical protein